jgi:hypothetical protein
MYTAICSPLLPTEFALLLAEHTHSSVDQIYEMVSTCAGCRQGAVYPVMAIEGESWFGNTDTASGQLKLAVYGLCERCAALPDIIQIINRKTFEQLRMRR